MESRLGPKVNNSENYGRYHAQQQAQVDDDVFGDSDKPASVMGRVIVEHQKSRDEVLAEGEQKMDKKEKQVMQSF